MPMIFRSPVTRLILAGVATTAGAVLAFGNGNHWRATPSLRWLSNLGMPLQVWGLAFIAYAVLLMFVSTRPAGYAFGAFLFAVFAVSLLATIDDGTPKNIIVIGALLDVVVLHVYSIRTAEAIKQTTPTHRKGTT